MRISSINGSIRWRTVRLRSFVLCWSRFGLNFPFCAIFFLLFFFALYLFLCCHWFSSQPAIPSFRRGRGRKKRRNLWKMERAPPKPSSVSDPVTPFFTMTKIPSHSSAEFSRRKERVVSSSQLCSFCRYSIFPPFY